MVVQGDVPRDVGDVMGRNASLDGVQHGTLAKVLAEPGASNR